MYYGYDCFIYFLPPFLDFLDFLVLLAALRRPPLSELRLFLDLPPVKGAAVSARLLGVLAMVSAATTAGATAAAPLPPAIASLMAVWIISFSLAVEPKTMSSVDLTMSFSELILVR